MSLVYYFFGTRCIAYDDTYEILKLGLQRLYVVKKAVIGC